MAVLGNERKKYSEQYIDALNRTGSQANLSGLQQTAAQRYSGQKPDRTGAQESTPTNTPTTGAQTPTTGAGAVNTAGTAAGQTTNYASQLSSLYDQIVNRAPFNYDLNGDMLYRQYADQYSQLGQMAMRDTMGQAAALTGGYGNSYASTAGQQAYQQYLTQLNAMVPDLYDRAYQRYQDDMTTMMTLYDFIKARQTEAEAKNKQRSSGGSSGSGGDSDKSDDTGNGSSGSGFWSDFQQGLDSSLLNLAALQGLDLSQYSTDMDALLNAQGNANSPVRTATDANRPASGSNALTFGGTTPLYQEFLRQLGLTQ